MNRQGNIGKHRGPFCSENSRSVADFPFAIKIALFTGGYWELLTQSSCIWQIQGRRFRDVGFHFSSPEARVRPTLCVCVCVCVFVCVSERERERERDRGVEIDR